MSPQPPAIPHWIIVQTSSSKHHDHSSGGPRTTESRGVVNSWRWKLTLTLNLNPGKWRLDDVEDPAVVDRLIADVASEDHEVGL